MAKGKVKIEELTLSDRVNLLDLFVNNHKTLSVVHETLFPKVIRTLNNQSEMKTVNSDT
jgi:hypothetical protein